MELFIFFIVSTISFVGSLQAGSVNVMVIKTTILKSKSAAVRLAVGGSLPEMIYSTIAIYCGVAIEKNIFFLQSIEWLTIVAFLILGLQNIYKMPRSDFKQVGYKGGGKDFFTGFILALLNPQLLIFWFGIFIYLDTNWLMIKSFAERLAFVTGTSFGSFVLLYTLASLSHRYKEKIYILLKSFSIHKLTGWFFILLAVIKISIIVFNRFFL